MRALFYCSEERRHSANDDAPRTYKLLAQSPQTEDERNDPEINAFWAATPTGTIELFTVNPAARLTPGKRYYVDFTEHPSNAA